MKKNRSALRFHFVHCHLRDAIVVLKKGDEPLPHCPKCDMFVKWRVFNRTYQATEMCVW